MSRWAGAVALAVALAACGGGGGEDSNANPSQQGSSASAGGATLNLRLAGVAAHGAPLTGARVRALDSTGTVVASTTANTADGSFALNLQAVAGPLLLQAVGTDATGLPLVLHSALAKVSEGQAVLHITPLTDAAVALALGSEPRTLVSALLANAGTGTSSAASALAPLANLSGAAGLLAAVFKTNLTDAKLADPAKPDFFSDASFSANKTGLDLVLESLNIGYGLNAKGGGQLQLANKLGSTAVEVTVDLATAAAELARSGGTPASAITSTLKTTTSPTPLMANLAKLDDLVATLNGVLAAAITSTSPTALADGLTASGLLASYERQDGADKAQLEARLADFASRKMQIGRVQVTGCMDEVVDKTGCKRVALAARVHDASGALVGSLLDAASFDTKAKPKARWTLLGNGQLADAQARSLAWRALAADGSAADASSPVRLGVQLSVGSTATSATVQTPSGYVLPMTACNRSTLCIALPADAGIASLAQGALAEDTVFQGTNAWMGASDANSAARYKAALVGTALSTNRTSTLRGVFTTPPAAARFATPDDLGSSQPLLASALQAPLSLNWSRWASAQPDMRVVWLRSVLVSSSGALATAELSPGWSATSATLNPPALATGFDVAKATLWIAAIDSAGRWYHSSIGAR